jgi:hypothetical protein
MAFYGYSSLQPSGPVTATANNQVIEGLSITSASGDAVTVNGFNNVTIRNCAIHHAGGRGINGANCSGLSVDHVDIIASDAQPTGQNPSAAYNNIELFNATGAQLTNLRLTGGSTGIYLISCASAVAQYIEGHNFRGPYPRGQLAQFDKSGGAQLLDFSVENDVNVAWTEDSVSIFQSLNAVVARGLIDGNNSPSGWGVLFEAGSTGTCTDVDAVNWSNGGIATANCSGIIFTRCRAKNSYSPCAQSRGVPSSGSRAFGAFGTGSGHEFRACRYFNLADPVNPLVVPNASVVDIVSGDFTPRAAIRVTGLPS